MAGLKATDLRFADLLPSSIAGDATIAAAAEALEEHLQGVSRDIDLARIYSRIAELPETALDLLAWQFHVDFWLQSLPVESKRSLVEGSIAWHRRKGTAWAVKRILSDLGVEAEVIQWHQPGGEELERFTFAVRGMIRRPLLAAEMWGPETIAEVERAVSMAKNARSWLDWLTLALEIEVDAGPLGQESTWLVREANVLPLSFGPFFDVLPMDGMDLDNSGVDQAPTAREGVEAALEMGRPWSLDMLQPEGSAPAMDFMIPGMEGEAIPPLDYLLSCAVFSLPPFVAAARSASSAALSIQAQVAALPVTSINSTSTAAAAFGADDVGLDTAPGFDEVALDACPLDAMMEVTHV